MRELVYSTNPDVNRKLCELYHRRSNLHTPIMSSERVGYSHEAMIVCERVNQATRSCYVLGQYKAVTNKKRVNRMHLPTLRRALHIIDKKISL
jgi:hypothetical protein